MSDIVENINEKQVKSIKRIHVRSRKDKIYANKNEATKHFMNTHYFICEICNIKLKYASKYDHLKSQKHSLKTNIRINKTIKLLQIFKLKNDKIITKTFIEKR